MNEGAIVAICGVIIAAFQVLNTWLTIKSGQASAGAKVAAERAVTETVAGNKAVAEVKVVAEQAVKETQDGNATLSLVHKAVNGGADGLTAKINELQAYVNEVMKAATEQERQRGAEAISARLTALHDTLMLKVVELKTENAVLKAAAKTEG